MTAAAATVLSGSVAGNSTEAPLSPNEGEAGVQDGVLEAPAQGGAHGKGTSPPVLRPVVAGGGSADGSIAGGSSPGAQAPAPPAFFNPFAFQIVPLLPEGGQLAGAEPRQLASKLQSQRGGRVSTKPRDVGMVGRKSRIGATGPVLMEHPGKDVGPGGLPELQAGSGGGGPGFPPTPPTESEDEDGARTPESVEAPPKRGGGSMAAVVEVVSHAAAGAVNAAHAAANVAAGAVGVVHAAANVFSHAAAAPAVAVEKAVQQARGVMAAAMDYVRGLLQNTEGLPDALEDEELVVTTALVQLAQVDEDLDNRVRALGPEFKEELVARTTVLVAEAMKQSRRASTIRRGLSFPGRSTMRGAPLPSALDQEFLEAEPRSATGQLDPMVGGGGGGVGGKEISPMPSRRGSPGLGGATTSGLARLAQRRGALEAVTDPLRGGYFGEQENGTDPEEDPGFTTRATGAKEQSKTVWGRAGEVVRGGNADVFGTLPPEVVVALIP